MHTVYSWRGSSRRLCQRKTRTHAIYNGSQFQQQKGFVCKIQYGWRATIRSRCYHTVTWSSQSGTSYFQLCRAVPTHIKSRGDGWRWDSCTYHARIWSARQKGLARKIKGHIQKWKAQANAITYKAIKAKFEQNPSLTLTILIWQKFWNSNTNI